ncbi:MAG: V-type ATP synthase subunit A [Spirochaetaceae bacterium]|jgi:V/A-type H+-transporting ATPase subunit A|nr:V-type ATP synthase subunit A [Spirochaetaceae bacterium]
MKNTGKVVGVNGNMVSVEVTGVVSMNEVAYIDTDGKKLKSEVIRIQGDKVQVQVFEMTKGIMINDEVEFSEEMLTVELGPGLIGQVYDGLQNPLPELAEEAGFFLERGVYLDALHREREWEFSPLVSSGAIVTAGDILGSVPENNFTHKIMVPFNLFDTYTVKSIKEKGFFKLKDTVVELADDKGNVFNVSLVFSWPIKRAIKCYDERLKPVDPLVTKIRLIDTFLPVAKGGTFCIPGPFGAGKTVLQQAMSKNAEVDIVIVAACGERAGEVVETLKEFPELLDPKTGRSLMERTIIICNTSSMPVASREASVYTAVTLAEYYRQMGLDVMLLADSTSRWAQAMREMSGRLEEIPGEEAFPAYLESSIAGFYERAGIVKLKNGEKGSVTICGTVSPAGGNFEEPVTQATLKVVGAFLGLSRERSDARKYPAIHPLDSWSKYSGLINLDQTTYAYDLLCRSYEIGSMMKVVGEEGTSTDDFIVYVKGEFLDAVYYQQNSFDPVDAAVNPDRQLFQFNQIMKILTAELDLDTKEEVRSWFNKIRQTFLDSNSSSWESDEFKSYDKEINNLIADKKVGVLANAVKLMEK